MRLKHITFTGIDARTDINALKEIQKRYPVAEFGVLTSYHLYENGNRYPDTKLFESLDRLGLNLSLHLCGGIAHDAACGIWGKVREHVTNLNAFKRIQLNVAERKDNPRYVFHVPWQEIIIQTNVPENDGLYRQSSRMYPKGRVSMLLDASGGRGLDTGMEIYSSDEKIGYAGGINPDNVAEKLSFLLGNVHTGSFWIDMESGVRTNDWFDLNKVTKVLETCENIIKQHKS